MIKKLLLSLLPILLLGCSENNEQKDMESPRIEEGNDPSPFNCQTILRGEVLPVRCLFTDNKELGAFNIEIHNNFDHHSHSTSAEDCPSDPDRKPDNPWIHNEDMQIPTGTTAYDLNIEIPIPADVDTGDYHFMIRLTDRAGWQVFKAVSLKMR